MPQTDRITLRIDGRPQAVQSARFDARTGKAYQPAEINQWKAYVRLRARTLVRRLYPDFRPFDGVPVAVSLSYFFPMPKNARRNLIDAINAGRRVFKPTRPDVADNLNKGLMDALTGVLWADDGLVVSALARKFFTLGQPYTLVEAWPVPQIEAQEAAEQSNDPASGGK